MSCPVEHEAVGTSAPLWKDGHLTFSVHHVGWIVAGVCTLIAIAASFWLISKHLAFFYNKAQQRHIARILFLVPLYSVCSFLSYLFYHEALYFQLVRDGYEGFVIASFFSLLLEYLSAPKPTIDQPLQQLYTRRDRDKILHESIKHVRLKKWMWPLGCLPVGSWGRSERFVWLMRVCIGQYVILRPLTTMICHSFVIGEATGTYCLASWSPRFVHVYTSVIVSLSVTVAMYALLQLYWPLRREFRPFSPVLKFFSVKAVVFLTFWQETTLSLFVTFGWIKSSETWTAEQIVVGIAALLSCFEMMLFAFMHLKAFSYLPYRGLAPVAATEEDDKLRHLKADGTPLLVRTKRLPALVQCVSLRDICRELKDQLVFVFRKGYVAPDRHDDLELLQEKRPLAEDAGPMPRQSSDERQSASSEVLVPGPRLPSPVPNGFAQPPVTLPSPAAFPRPHASLPPGAAPSIYHAA